MQKLWVRERHLRAIEVRICADLAGKLSKRLQGETLTQWQLCHLVARRIAAEVPAGQQKRLLLAASRLFKL